MGTVAEDYAGAFRFTRRRRTLCTGFTDAGAGGAGLGRICPRNCSVRVSGRKGDTVIRVDERPTTARPDRILSGTSFPRMHRDVGKLFAISDGATALIAGERPCRAGRGPAHPRASPGHASHAQAPALFPTAPVPAARKLLSRLRWHVEDVDLWEVNEAFAVVPMAFMAELGVPLTGSTSMVVPARFVIRSGPAARGSSSPPVRPRNARPQTWNCRHMSRRRRRHGDRDRTSLTSFRFSVGPNILGGAFAEGVGGRQAPTTPPGPPMTIDYDALTTRIAALCHGETDTGV